MKKSQKKTDHTHSGLCPCGSRSSYALCCQPYHDGAAAATAEALMRARYSAYTLGLMHYVYTSWHASTRPALTELAHDTTIKWLGLEVRKFVVEQDAAQVEFIARSKSAGRAQRLHEVSHFIKEEGRWFYVDGVFPQ